MKLGFWLALLLAFLPAAHAAPRAPRPASPAQVDGIISAAVDKMWQQNDAYWHEGDYPRVIALDRIITRADPHFVEAFNTGAWLMWSDGHDGDAQAFYQEDVRHNPRASAAYYDYGMFLVNHRRDYPAAIRVLKTDTQRADAGVLDWRMLAHAHERSGDWAGAVRVWRAIKFKWPHGAPQDPSRGQVDDQNMGRALAHLQKASGT